MNLGKHVDRLPKVTGNDFWNIIWSLSMFGASDNHNEKGKVSLEPCQTERLLS